MKVKIEFDLAEAARVSQDTLYTTVYHLFEGLALDIAEPGAFEGQVTVPRRSARGSEPVVVGEWGIE